MEHACWCKMILPEYIRGCGVGLSSVMYVMTYILRAVEMPDVAATCQGNKAIRDYTSIYSIAN